MIHPLPGIQPGCLQLRRPCEFGSSVRVFFAFSTMGRPVRLLACGRLLGKQPNYWVDGQVHDGCLTYTIQFDLTSRATAEAETVGTLHAEAVAALLVCMHRWRIMEHREVVSCIIAGLDRCHLLLDRHRSPF